MTRALEVLSTGPLVLVEDEGRPGHAAMGVGRSGAADRGAYRLGARIAGHGEDRAALEILLGGLAVRALGRMTVVVTGAPAPTSLDGRTVAHATLVDVTAGSVLTLGMPASGLRSYLTVRGGIDVEPVLGSRSTDTLSLVGPAPPRRGDVLPVGAPGAPSPPSTTWPCRRPPAQVSPCSRCCPGRERRGSAGGAVTWAGCWDWCGTSPATATGWAFASVVPVSGGSRRGAVSSFPARGWSGVPCRSRPAGSRWSSSPTTR